MINFGRGGAIAKGGQEPNYYTKTVRVFGHSYTQFIASSASWPTKVAALLGMTLTNSGVSNTFAQENVINHLGIADIPLTQDVIIFDSMCNDLRRLGLGTNAVNRWKDIITAGVRLARAASYTAAPTRATPAMGTIANTNHLGGSVRYQGVTGDFHEIDFTGDAVTIYSLIFRADASVAGVTQYKTMPDAIVRATHDCGPAAGIPAGYPTSWTIVPIHISGLGAGAHTIRGTKTSGANIYFNGFSVPKTTPPIVVLVKDQRIPYWTLGAPSDQGSDAAVTAYNAALDAVAASFPDGKVITAGAASWDPLVDIGPDLLHPTEIGIIRYTNGIKTALQTL